MLSVFQLILTFASPLLYDSSGNCVVRDGLEIQCIKNPRGKSLQEVFSPARSGSVLVLYAVTQTTMLA